MGTGTVIGIGVGVLALGGGAYWFYRRRATAGTFSAVLGSLPIGRPIYGGLVDAPVGGLDAQTTSAVDSAIAANRARMTTTVSAGLAAAAAVVASQTNSVATMADTRPVMRGLPPPVVDPFERPEEW
jgi:hypothetical protein